MSHFLPPSRALLGPGESQSEPGPERPRGPPLACGAHSHPQPNASSTPVTLALAPDNPPAPRLHSGWVPADTLAPAGAVTSGGHLCPLSLCCQEGKKPQGGVVGGTSGLMSKRLVSGHSPSPAAQQETRRGWGGGAGMGGAAGRRVGTPGRPDSTSSPVPPDTGRAVSARGASVAGVQFSGITLPVRRLGARTQGHRRGGCAGTMCREIARGASARSERGEGVLRGCAGRMLREDVRGGRDGRAGGEDVTGERAGRT